jgi:cation:H+ antiporter
VGLGAAVALFVFTRSDAEVGVHLGFGLLATLAIYSLFVFAQERLHLARSARVAVAEQVDERHPMSVGTGAVSVGAGLVALIFGASLLVDSGVNIARSWGVSETVIGLTLIAGGTSLPELATSAVAALRRQGDIAIGNVLGSNIYNILAILGATALVTPLPVPERIIAFDLPMLIGVSLFLLALLLFERRVGRWAGLVLFACFVLYIYATYRGWA